MKSSYIMFFILSSLTLLHFIILVQSSTATTTTAAPLLPVELAIANDRFSIHALQDAILAYKLIDQSLNISMIAGTSIANNILAINKEQADVAMISTTLPAASALANPTFFTLPLLASAIVPVYRLDAIDASIPLIFTRDVLARIMMANITWWNDTAIIAANPSQTMPKQKIIIVYENSNSITNLISSQALAKFNSNFTSVVPTAGTERVRWPTTKWASYIRAPGVTGVGATILATDGSFGLISQSIAEQLNNKIGSMINKAGNIVRASSQSVTFAAVELGTSISLTSYKAADLTDCSSSSGWPITAFSYLLIDTERSRSTCHARAALVEFFLYFYQSATVASLLANRNYSPVPSIVMEQLNIIETFGTLVQCRGQSALATIPTTKRTLGVSTQISFLSSLFTSIYKDSNIDWQLDVNTDEINFKRLLNSEVDLIIVNPDNIDEELYSVITDSINADGTINYDSDYLILPSFTFGWSFLYNTQLTDDYDFAVESTARPMIFDMETIGLIYDSCILDWQNINILTLNPWLAPLIGNNHTAIQQIIPCLTSTMKDSPATQFIRSEIQKYVTLNPNSRLAHCQGNYSFERQYEQCINIPAYGVQFIGNEAVSASLIYGTNGGMGVISVNGDSSITLPLMQVERNGELVNTAADVDGLMACALDTFDPKTLTFNFDASSNISCYPWTQSYSMIVRKHYTNDPTVSTNSAASCTRGLDALQFAYWLISNQQLDALTESVNVGRLSNVPGVKQAYINALNSVLCDGETLLITLPIVWELSSGLSGFGIAAAIIGGVLTVSLMIFTVIYHKHPIMRSSSPLFTLISLFGVLLMFAGAVALVANVTTFSCGILSWLINLGIMVTFAPIFAKTWRIYRIFGRRKLSVVKISNRKLMLIIGGLLTMEIVIMIVWQILSPIQPYISSTMEGSPSRQHDYEQCGVRNNGSSMFAVAAVEKGLLLVFGALMAFSTRKVSSQFNESSQIALAIYNVVFSIGIIAPIIFVINATGDILIALLLFVLLWIAFFTASILVIPKALHILSPQNADQNNASVVGSSGNSSSGYSFLSLNILETAAMCTGYLAALRKHVELVENRLNGFKRSSVSINNNGSTNNSSINHSMIKDSKFGLENTLVGRSARDSISLNNNYTHNRNDSISAQNNNHNENENNKRLSNGSMLINRSHINSAPTSARTINTNNLHNNNNNTNTSSARTSISLIRVNGINGNGNDNNNTSSVDSNDSVIRHLSSRANPALVTGISTVDTVSVIQSVEE